jgi:hypothetical protein
MTHAVKNLIWLRAPKTHVRSTAFFTLHSLQRVQSEESGAQRCKGRVSGALAGAQLGRAAGGAAKKKRRSSKAGGAQLGAKHSGYAL